MYSICSFHVYSIVIKYLNTLWIDYHGKSSVSIQSYYNTIDYTPSAVYDILYT